MKVALELTDGERLRWDVILYESALRILRSDSESRMFLKVSAAKTAPRPRHPLALQGLEAPPDSSISGSDLLSQNKAR